MLKLKLGPYKSLRKILQGSEKCSEQSDSKVMHPAC